MPPVRFPVVHRIVLGELNKKPTGASEKESCSHLPIHFFFFIFYFFYLFDVARLTSENSRVEHGKRRRFEPLTKNPLDSSDSPIHRSIYSILTPLSDQLKFPIAHCECTNLMLNPIINIHTISIPRSLYTLYIIYNKRSSISE